MLIVYMPQVEATEEKTVVKENLEDILNTIEDRVGSEICNAIRGCFTDVKDDVEANCYKNLEAVYCDVSDAVEHVTDVCDIKRTTKAQREALKELEESANNLARALMI